MLSNYRVVSALVKSQLLRGRTALGKKMRLRGELFAQWFFTRFT